MVSSSWLDVGRWLPNEFNHILVFERIPFEMKWIKGKKNSIKKNFVLNQCFFPQISLIEFNLNLYNIIKIYFIFKKFFIRNIKLERILSLKRKIKLNFLKWKKTQRKFFSLNGKSNTEEKKKKVKIKWVWNCFKII